MLSRMWQEAYKPFARNIFQKNSKDENTITKWKWQNLQGENCIVQICVVDYFKERRNRKGKNHIVQTKNSANNVSIFLIQKSKWAQICD